MTDLEHTPDDGAGDGGGGDGRRADGRGAGGRDLLSRRQVLTAAGVAAGVAVGGGAVGLAQLRKSKHDDPAPKVVRRTNRRLRSFPSKSTGASPKFRSRPDLHPAPVATAGTAGAPGYLFLGPGSTDGFTKGPPKGGPQQGPQIVDERGELVWFRPLPGTDWATNVRVQSYRGQPVLTWWQGKVVNPGFGQGEGVIVDASYREVARVRAGNGRQADLHEFLLTPQGTALITCCPPAVRADLTPIGGPRGGQVLESIIQEIDVASGRLLFEWRSLDHIAVSESYQPYAQPYDYLHVNSIEPLPDGNLLVSARATFGLYKLDRRTGAVIWRLGGKRSDFKLGQGAAFAWQHDARQIADGMITIFDDGAGPEKAEKQSRAIILEVDEARRTAALGRAYRHPTPLLAASMGNVQLLPDGHVLVGWGAQRYVSEFTATGKWLADARLPPGLLSYRAYRCPWRGIPHLPPALVSRRDNDPDPPVLFASWNGATEITHWRVEVGPSADRLRPFGIAKRLGFETGIPLKVSEGYAAVTALDAGGHALARSAAIRI